MHRLLKLTGALALVLGITACPGIFGGEEENEPLLLVTARPTRIDDVGQASTLTVTATDGKDEPGTGSVELTAAAGVFDNDQSTITLTLENGGATTTYKCPKAQDVGCRGGVAIDAQWGQATSKVTITVGSGTTTPDGGTDGGPIKPPPTDGGAGDGGPGVSLSVSKNPIFYNVGDYAIVTATLKRTNGTVWAGETIAFDTTIGGLQPTDGGTTPVQSLSATTASDGIAQVRFVETGSPGTASIQAKHEASGQAKSIQVDVTTVQQLTHKSTLCNGTACTIMGVRGSGFNEQAQITFNLKDSSNRPAVGVKVTFSIPNAPMNTTVTPFGYTNAQGDVTATISAGPTIGAIVVHATAIPGLVEVDSPTIGIRGAKPTNNGLSIQCNLVNIAAYVSPDPPAAFDVGCKVKVVDRYNNPVGTGTPVNFKAEAGNITTSVNTTPYSPTGNNINEGEGSVTFKTRGGTNFPVDVTPLEANPSQFPFSRSKEPRVLSGQLERNPRDSLVTIIAYTRGEEYFSDDNSNGIRDANEQFIDQGEPYVDSNDNGVRDEGEIYIDEAPADGKWNPPNGVWDKDTSIWSEAFILYTGRPVASNSLLMRRPGGYPPVYTTFSGGCGNGLAKGTDVIIEGYFGDEFLNRPQAAATGFNISHTASKGSVSQLISGLQDGYGFGIERRKINPVDGSDCTPAVKVCNWRTLFYDWGYGYTGQFQIKGASTTDVTPCQTDRVYITCTVLNIGLAIPIDGAIE
ncbi:hypothetical protein JRI60_10580 [Archangium violaceum]|uniref:hypothetical protein n=1 Tax=Archangium violaceum TaxID=83451 RepID=UPI001950396D|nr:hypothetical protein [Archangium violaceum]QRN99427.1 hypothetical protein JRI60_10580 [Archangium violaceum]